MVCNTNQLAGVKNMPRPIGKGWTGARTHPVLQDFWIDAGFLEGTLLKEEFSMSIRSLSLLWGFAYTFFIGFCSLPRGVGATITILVLISFLYRHMQRNAIPLTHLDRLNLLTGAALGIGLGFTSNVLVVTLSGFALFFIISMFAVAIFTRTPVPASLEAYAAGVSKVCGQAIRQLVLSATMWSPGFQLDRQLLSGLLIAIIPVGGFHLLFSQVNREYAAFIEAAFEYLFNLEFLQFLAKALVQSYLFSCIASVRVTMEPAGTSERLRKWTYVLIPCIVCFALFTPFQAKLLFQKVATLNFQALSLYTQRGFWELVTVSALGLIVWMICRARGLDINSYFRTSRLLKIFCAELIIVAIFTAHKIVTLQYVFGLKDTRVFATGVVAMIFCTFLLCYTRGHLSSIGTTLFRTQSAVALILLAVASLINLETVITRTFPIRYHVNGDWQPDYSYLLTNSYDNYSEWGNLMRTAGGEGIKTPSNYYWGDYRPLCPRYTTRQGETRTYDSLALFHSRLIADVDTRMQTLQGRLSLQYNEFRAYQWLMANPGIREEMRHTVNSSCAFPE